jgi:hypothetical protein
MALAHWLKRHSLEVQFWGYEVGNIVASITGAGGLRAFADSFAEAYRTSGFAPLALALWLAREHPETFATVGVMAIVVIAFPLSAAVARRFGPRAADAVNALAVPLALALLAFAVVRTANLFTVAACAFVVGSCLLRGAGHFPLLLKLGGLALSVGGLTLAGAGVMVLAAQMFGAGGLGVALSAATFLSGVFVAGAGLLTYQGGCFVMREVQTTGGGEVPRGIVQRLLSARGPLAGFMARRLDPPVDWSIRWLVHPGLFWIPERTKRTQPFRTSMLARLPWRLIAGTLALATGTAAGACFALANLLWAVGDVAIGALDSAPAVPAAGQMPDAETGLP